MILFQFLWIFVIGCSLIVANATKGGQWRRDLEWAKYKHQFNKSYQQPAEEERRYLNFLQARAEVRRHNANPRSTYKKALNHLSDWHVDEFTYSSARGEDRPLDRDGRRQRTQMGANPTQLISGRAGQTPDQLDWRKSAGRVGPVKDQGKCGAGWAFAATGLLEGQQVVRNITKNLVSLSEQELFDCSDSGQNCKGGSVENALIDVAWLNGIESESTYPYKGGQTSACAFNKSRAIMTCIGCLSHLNITEHALKQQVAEYGPISVGVHATSHMAAYESGIFEDKTCVQNKINHYLLIVGYGSDPAAGDFWILKNSWGKKWGERGYMRMRFGLNMCGLQQFATLVVF